MTGTMTLYHNDIQIASVIFNSPKKRRVLYENWVKIYALPKKLCFFEVAYENTQGRYMGRGYLKMPQIRRKARF